MLQVYLTAFAGTATTAFFYGTTITPGAKGITRAAFSVTGDIGFENGGGVTPFGNGKTGAPAQNFISGMVYNRLWFGEHFAWTIGGGYMHNPGRYLVLAPTGDASPIPPVGTHPVYIKPR